MFPWLSAVKTHNQRTKAESSLPDYVYNYVILRIIYRYIMSRSIFRFYSRFIVRVSPQSMATSTVLLWKDFKNIKNIETVCCDCVFFEVIQQLVLGVF